MIKIFLFGAMDVVDMDVPDREGQSISRRIGNIPLRLLAFQLIEGKKKAGIIMPHLYVGADDRRDSTIRQHNKKLREVFAPYFPGHDGLDVVLSGQSDAVEIDVLQFDRWVGSSAPERIREALRLRERGSLLQELQIEPWAQEARARREKCVEQAVNNLFSSAETPDDFHLMLGLIQSILAKTPMQDDALRPFLVEKENFLKDSETEEQKRRIKALAGSAVEVPSPYVPSLLPGLEPDIAMSPAGMANSAQAELTLIQAESNMRNRNIVGEFPRIAICGSIRHCASGSSVALLIEEINAELASFLLLRYSMHILHAPEGPGHNVVDKMYHMMPIEINSGKMKIYHTEIRVEHRPMIEDADVIIILGGTQRTKIHIAIAHSLGKPILPICCTGGAAEDCYQDMKKKPDHYLQWMTRGEFEELGELKSPHGIVNVLEGIIRRITRPAAM